MWEKVLPLELRFYPDPVLREKCKEVKEITPEIKQLLRDMIRVMHSKRGAGLAGPQVGQLKRVIVVDARWGAISLVNPRIIGEKGSRMEREGCLSLPGEHVKVRRAQEVVVEGLDVNGEIVKISAQGLRARVFQHEIDHLDGILIIDKKKNKNK